MTDSTASAKHKFGKALRLDPHNETALFELDIVNRIIELDDQIPLDSVPSMKRPPNRANGANDNGGSGVGQVCARSCNNQACRIF